MVRDNPPQNEQFEYRDSPGILQVPKVPPVLVNSSDDSRQCFFRYIFQTIAAFFQYADALTTGLGGSFDATTSLFSKGDLPVLDHCLVRHLLHVHDDVVGAVDTEISADYRHEECAEQDAQNDAGNNVPPVMPVVADSGCGTRHGPHAHQTLQPRLEVHHPGRQAIL